VAPLASALARAVSFRVVASCARVGLPGATTHAIAHVNIVRNILTFLETAG
jgi:hypothetical protein